MLKVYLRNVILSYDEMLKHMVGRITTKPGGKPEMGEVSLLIPVISSRVNGSDQCICGEVIFPSY
jgi:hypothetical protein